jgi:membrane protein implicated in regulation of membrane protease activity
MNNMLLIWILVGVGCVMIDLATNAFLFVWFAIGAFAAIIAQLLGYSTFVQVIIFAAVSIVFMAIGYPLVKKTIKQTVKKTPTMEQSYIGRTFTADEDVVEKALVKIDGIYWTVKNEGERVVKGDKIKIVGIKGNKIIINKIKGEK